VPPADGVSLILLPLLRLLRFSRMDGAHHQPGVNPLPVCLNQHQLKRPSLK
jgi:hypothetical protein